MKIVIDLQGAQTESRFRGIGRYSLSIAKAIVKNRENHEIIIALSNLFPDTIEELKNEFKDILPQENIKVWNGLAPTRECEDGNEQNREISEVLREAFLQSLKPDVILLTSLFEGFGDDAITSIKKFDTNTKIAVTSHDLIPLIQKDIYLPHNQLYTKHYMQKIEHLKKADLFLGVSQSSCNELIKYLKIDSKKIINTSEAVDEGFKSQLLNNAEKENLYKKYNINKKTILYAPGGFDIRKNFENLIKAYAQLSKAIQAEYQLVIVSKIDDGNKERLQKLAKNEGIDKHDLILTGYVSDDDLISFYGICDLFVFVSIHEGFGLPVLEAMNCGAVVIGSNTTSIPEVIGCEEALFDPYSVESIRDKIEEVLNDEKLQNRLLKHSKKQIQKFTWDKSAKVAINALERSFHLNNNKTCPSMDDIINKISKYIPETYTEDELYKIATSIKNNQDQFIKKQLFLDISELSQRDSATGVQRVVKAYLKELLLSPPDGYIVSPVYATIDEPYKYASKFTAKFLGNKNSESLVDEPISWHQGDIFFGLDMQHHVQLAHKNFYHTLKNDGVIVKFLIYDLLPIELENLFKDNNHNKLHEDLMRMFAQFDGVINISKATSTSYSQWLDKNNIILLSHFQDDWVHMGSNINASNPSKGLTDDAIEILDILKLRETFLSVSTIEPRKKQDQIFEAVEILWQKDYDINLVFVGKKGWKTEDFIDKIVNHKENKKRLFWLDGISDEYLEKVYENSSSLIAASINEGFGLPLIEAAQHDLPIIARDIEVFREVAGEYAFYFNGFEPKDLADSLEKWLSLYKNKNHPKSTDMSYLTWKESATYLKEILVNNKPKKTLFLDISELVQRDAKSGIQRVVRSVMLELFKNPPKEYDIKPVYATIEDDYKYATNFTYKFLGHEVDFIEEKYMEYKSGDIFFLLDMQPQVQIVKQDFYQKMKESGVNIKFLLHDLLPISMEKYFPEGNKEGFITWLKALSFSTNGVVCVSNSTAVDFKKWYIDNISKSIKNFNISVSHNGADIDNSNPSKGLPKNATQVLDKIEKKISFICVGTIEPRKGHIQTLKAFEKLWGDGFDISLVFVGKIGWNVDTLISSLRKHSELNKRLFWLEGISDEYLEKVYDASDCLIASSEGEGFGLPLIEAAQKKLPIIARDIPVFKEVSGKFAYYFTNDNDPQVLVNTIKEWLKLYKNEEHPKSDDMPWLSWEESTKQLMECVFDGKN